MRGLKWPSSTELFAPIFVHGVEKSLFCQPIGALLIAPGRLNFSWPWAGEEPQYFDWSAPTVIFSMIGYSSLIILEFVPLIINSKFFGISYNWNNLDPKSAILWKVLIFNQEIISRKFWKSKYIGLILDISVLPNSFWIASSWLLHFSSAHFTWSLFSQQRLLMPIRLPSHLSPSLSVSTFSLLVRQQYFPSKYANLWVDGHEPTEFFIQWLFFCIHHRRSTAPFCPFSIKGSMLGR